MAPAGYLVPEKLLSTTMEDGELPHYVRNGVCRDAVRAVFSKDSYSLSIITSSAEYSRKRKTTFSTVYERPRKTEKTMSQVSGF